MAKYARLLFLSVLLGLFSVTAQADGIPPSEETVCDVLNASGVTKGLFGLCNAFCEAKDCDEYPVGEMPRSCDRLLNNYEKKRNRANNPLDPEMPCLAEPAVVCPCWPAESGRLADGGLGLAGSDCVFDGPNPPELFDVAIYDDGSDMVSFVADVGQCEYMNTLSGEDEVLGTSAEENAACRTDVHGLQDQDFGGTENCVQLP